MFRGLRDRVMAARAGRQPMPAPMRKPLIQARPMQGGLMQAGGSGMRPWTQQDFMAGAGQLNPAQVAANKQMAIEMQKGPSVASKMRELQSMEQQHRQAMMAQRAGGNLASQQPNPEAYRAAMAQYQAAGGNPNARMHAFKKGGHVKNPDKPMPSTMPMKGSKGAVTDKPSMKKFSKGGMVPKHVVAPCKSLPVSPRKEMAMMGVRGKKSNTW